jgi:hypothetical protein
VVFEGVVAMTAILGTDLSLPDVVTKIAAEPPGQFGSRNHKISCSYYEIGRKLRQELGHDNADWATTAAWASGAVGVIIRHQETDTSSILRFVRRMGPGFYDDVLGQTRKNLEEGNRQVYSELGWAFAKLAEGVAGGVTWPASDDREFLSFLPLGGRSVPVEWQPETNLTPAFLLYLEALRLQAQEQSGEIGPRRARKRKAELIFTANVLVTVAEQAALQPYLDAGFKRVSRFIQNNPLGHLPYLRGGVQIVAYSAQALGQRVVTEFGIKVPVGDRSLGVGKPFHPRVGGGVWSPDLEILQDQRARRVWRKYSRAREDGSGSSASDWTVMDDRMNYIASFFRAWQQDPALREVPSFVEPDLVEPVITLP